MLNSHYSKPTHQGSLHWCIPRTHDDTHCRKRTFRPLSISCADICVLWKIVFVYSVTRCCNPVRLMILEGNVVPCAHMNTETPPHSDYHPKLYPLKHSVKNNHVLQLELERQREKLRYNSEVTRACASVHTLLLADLLDVETMASCGARLGAHTVLHPNGTLRNFTKNT